MKLFLTLLLILFSSQAYAGTYCVSTSGNDANTGIASGSGSGCAKCESGGDAQAWQTVSKVGTSAATLNAGDFICFKKGDTFNMAAALNPPENGTIGNLVTLTGSGTAGNWTSEENDVWSITLTDIQIPWRMTLDATEYEPAYEVKDIDSTNRWHVRPTSASMSTWKLYLYATSNPASFYSTIQYRDTTNHVTYSSYGTGAKPILNCINNITGWDTAGNWTDTGGNVWTFSLATNPVRVNINDTEYPAAEASGTYTISSTYRWRWSSSVLYVYSVGNPATTYTSIKGRGDCSAMINGSNEAYQIWDGLDIRGGSVSCFQNRGGQNMILQNMSLGYGGYGYIATAGAASTYNKNKNNILRNNVLDHQQNFADGVGYDDISGVREGIAHRESEENVWIYGNLIEQYDHGGIHMEAYSDPTNFPDGIKNVWIFGNEIDGSANYDMRYFSTLGADDRLRDVEIYYNYMHGGWTQSKLDGGGTEFGSIHVHDNIFADMQNPAYNTASQGVSMAIIYICLSSSWDSQNTLLENNVFINSEEPFIVMDQQSSSSCIKNGHVIRNNIFINGGTNVVAAGYENTMMMIDTGANVGANTYQNNIFYNDSGVTKIGYGGNLWNGSVYTVNEFNALNGNDGNTISGNILGNPLLTDYASGDYHISHLSSAFGAGLTTTRITDYYGNTIPKGTTDAGVHEADLYYETILSGVTIRGAKINP